MKNLLKKFAIVTVFCMMFASMQMVAFASEIETDTDTEDTTASTESTEVEPEDEAEDDVQDITPISETPVTTSNPETGAGKTTAAVASLGVISLAAAVATSRKRK